MTINEKKIEVYNLAAEIEKFAVQIKIRQAKIQKLNTEILNEEAGRHVIKDLVKDRKVDNKKNN